MVIPWTQVLIQIVIPMAWTPSCINAVRADWYWVWGFSWPYVKLFEVSIVTNATCSFLYVSLYISFVFKFGTCPFLSLFPFIFCFSSFYYYIPTYLLVKNLHPFFPIGIHQYQMTLFVDGLELGTAKSIHQSKLITLNYWRSRFLWKTH